MHFNCSDIRQHSAGFWQNAILNGKVQICYLAFNYIPVLLTTHYLSLQPFSLAMHPNFISFTLRRLLSGYPGRESDVILLVTTCADKNKVGPSSLSRRHYCLSRLPSTCNIITRWGLILLARQHDLEALNLYYTDNGWAFGFHCQTKR